MWSIFLSITLFFVSVSSFAADYTWTDSVFSGTYSDPSEALARFGSPFTMSESSPSEYLILSPDGSLRAYVNRLGDSCPSTKTYNSATGLCDALPVDLCKDSQGASGTSTVHSANGSPPSIVSKGGCEFTVGLISICKTSVTGGYTCNVTLTSTGNKLAVNPAGVDATDCSGADCAAALPLPETKNQDCVFSTNPDGTSSCTGSVFDSNPGTGNCVVSGSLTCTENPKATSVDTTTATTKTPTSNPAGTVTVVQDSTVTQVSCIGSPGTCSTSVSHSTGSTTTDSQGKVTGNSSSCTGKNCSTTGVAVGGSGSGSGTATSGTGSDDSGSSPSAGTLHDPGNGSFDGEGDEWDAKISTAKVEFKDGLDKLKDSFNPIGDINLSGGGGKLYCPPPVTVLGRDISFCLDRYAGSLSWISSAILALCAMIALMIVFC